MMTYYRLDWCAANYRFTERALKISEAHQREVNIASLASFQISNTPAGCQAAFAELLLLRMAKRRVLVRGLCLEMVTVLGDGLCWGWPLYEL